MVDLPAVIARLPTLMCGMIPVRGPRMAKSPTVTLPLSPHCATMMQWRPTTQLCSLPAPFRAQLAFQQIKFRQLRLRALEHLRGLGIRRLEGGMEALLHREIADQDEVPRLHEADGGGVVGGIENAVVSIPIEWLTP